MNPFPELNLWLSSYHVPVKEQWEGTSEKFIAVKTFFGISGSEGGLGEGGCSLVLEHIVCIQKVSGSIPRRFQS